MVALPAISDPPSATDVPRPQIAVDIGFVDGTKERAVTVTQQTDNFQAPPDCNAINIHAKIHVDD
jgi:hypothetical protein